MGPLIRRDHGEGVLVANPVEMVGLSDGRLEVNVCFVDKLVPIKMLNSCDVFFAHFDELLLQISFDLADASGFEGREIVWNNFGAKGRDRVGHESPSVDDSLGC